MGGKKKHTPKLLQQKRQPQVTGRKWFQIPLASEKILETTWKEKRLDLIRRMSVRRFMPFSKQKSEQLSPKILFRIELSFDMVLVM